jgi:hypothetical protein
MTQANSDKLFFKGLYGQPTYVVNTVGHFDFPAGYGVYEDNVRELIIFPVAGYSKTVSHYPSAGVPLSNHSNTNNVLSLLNGRSRQAIIGELYGALLQERGIPATSAAVVSFIDSTKVALVHEPHNPYDKDAILIFVTKNSSSYPIGYVPRSVNKIITERMSWLDMDTAQVIVQRDSKANHFVPQICIKYKAPLGIQSRFLNLDL